MRRAALVPIRTLAFFGRYACFYVAEGMLHVSGVLAVVCMGTFLAATFWPMVCSRASMEHVWHTVRLLYRSIRKAS